MSESNQDIMESYFGLFASEMTGWIFFGIITTLLTLLCIVSICLIRVCQNQKHIKTANANNNNSPTTVSGTVDTPISINENEIQCTQMAQTKKQRSTTQESVNLSSLIKRQFSTQIGGALKKRASQLAHTTEGVAIEINSNEASIDENIKNMFENKNDVINGVILPTTEPQFENQSSSLVRDIARQITRPSKIPKELRAFTDVKNIPINENEQLENGKMGKRPHSDSNSSSSSESQDSEDLYQSQNDNNGDKNVNVSSVPRKDTDSSLLYVSPQDVLNAMHGHDPIPPNAHPPIQ